MELVYDEGDAVVVGFGFGPSERASEAVVSIAVYPRRVSLVFLDGARLPDPDRMLQGRGVKARHVVLERSELVDDPRVASLVARALERAAPPIDSGRERRMVIKSVSANRRPRRPA